MIRLLMFLCLLASSLSYAEELGYYIPWMPKKYAYKEYKGKPDIDDPAFKEIWKLKKEMGGCELYPSKHRDLLMPELEKLVKASDIDALFEMHLRTEDTIRTNKEEGLPRKKWKYLDMAAKRGHLAANVKVIWADATEKNYLEKLELLDKYAQITPLGQLAKVALLGQFLDPRLEAEADKLKNVWQYPYVMSIGAVIRHSISKRLPPIVMDTDAFCEGYFYGCPFPDILNIKCGGTK